MIESIFPGSTANNFMPIFYDFVNCRVENLGGKNLLF